ncbi:MAG TPA: M23 family metallopeptidase, partial [bacterium]|nr:M23 family metallopeptidase [bacterium]
MSWFRSPQFARPIYFLSIGFLTLGLVAPGYLVQPVEQPGGFQFASSGGGALFDGGEVGGPLNFSEAFDSQYKEVIDRLDAYHAQKTAQESVSKSPGKGINAVPNPTLAGLYTFYPQAGNLRTGTSGGDLWINNYVDLDSSNPPDPEDRNNPDYILDWNGRDYTYNGHCGIDSDPRSFGEMDIGVPVFAVLDGQVVESHDGEWDRSTTFTSKPANYVVLDHGGGHYTLYWHFKNGSVTAAGMSAGVQVKAGQQIGLTGSSGISTGPHLHFESRYGGSQWWGGSHFEPWQGVQSPGQSAWENQPAFCGTPYSRDCGYTGTNLSGYPVPEPFPRTGSFTAGNRTIYFWYMGTNLPAGSTYRINLVRNGTVVYAPASQSFSFSGRSYWFYYSLTGNFDAATWRYDLYINHGGQGEQLVSAAPFTVGTVSNHAPNNITVAFDPSTPDPDKPVICRVQSDLLLDDPDYNIVYYDYLWRVNGVSVRTVTSAGMSDVLRHDLYGPGDTVSCTVTPRDGTVNGTNASTQYTFPDAVTPMEITATRDGNSIVFSEAQGLMVSEAIHLDVAATNGGAPPVSLSVSSGPSGYSFAAVAGDGDFDWTPTTLQVGDFPVIFRAQNASAEVAYATAVLRVSRPERRIIAQPGDHFISIGFDATNPPRVWSQIFEPFVGGPRIALGRLITEYLYLQPIYPQLDRFFTLDADDDGDNDLITVLVTGGAVNPKSWILVHDLMTGQKVRPALRVLYESVFQNPEWNDYLVADVDGNDISEVAAIGVAAGVEPKRYYVQSYDVWNRIRVGAMQLFTDLG